MGAGFYARRQMFFKTFENLSRPSWRRSQNRIWKLSDLRRDGGDSWLHSGRLGKVGLGNARLSLTEPTFFAGKHTFLSLPMVWLRPRAVLRQELRRDRSPQSASA